MIYITGICGFIGFHLTRKLVSLGYDVYGVDNLNNYYNLGLKLERKKILENLNVVIDTFDIKSITKKYKRSKKISLLIHLAAMPGVRHSYENPLLYITENVVGTQHVIDFAKDKNIENVLYASTSCVSAGNPLPWKEDDPTNMQLNPYGYTKRTNECQFSSTKEIKRKIGMRFFTVYGPFGRPDMALFSFCEAAIKREPIFLYNHGKMKRDWSHVEDVVNGIVILVEKILNDEREYHEIYNIGRGNPRELMDFVEQIEKNMHHKFTKIFTDKHPADTEETWADITKMQKLGWNPTVSIDEGIKDFCSWFKHWRK